MGQVGLSWFTLLLFVAVCRPVNLAQTTCIPSPHFRRRHRPKPSLSSVSFVSASRIRYEITSGNIGGAFAVKNMTGAIYVAGALDYETRKRVSTGCRCDGQLPPRLFVSRQLPEVLKGRVLSSRRQQGKGELAAVALTNRAEVNWVDFAEVRMQAGTTAG